MWGLVVIETSVKQAKLTNRVVSMYHAVLSVLCSMMKCCED